jgi:DNA-binding response OmpR family regulator
MEPHLPTILIVEDHSATRRFLADNLAADGYEPVVAQSVADGRRRIAAEPPDVAILDLGLPDGDGLKLLKDVRSRGNAVPILVLTARDAVEHRVAGLDTGADDYLIKPFAMSEVVARIKALLRRPEGALGALLKSGNIAFDTIGRDLRIGETVLVLPRRESAILEHLMRRAGRVVPKTVLEEKLYGIDDELGSNAIPVHVHHLRRKLMDRGATVAIHTVRGVGYLLVDGDA